MIRFCSLWCLVACAGKTSTPTLPTTDSDTPTTPAPVTVAGERFTLVSGDVVEGEVIATYDQRIWWWTPADETWFAVFDPAGWAEFPDDRSLTFLKDSDITGREDVQLEQTSWRNWLRDQGLTWPEPPLDGTSWVITGNDSYHLEEDGYGDFAWDLVKTDPDGARFTGAGAQNTEFLAWDEPVYAVTGGLVVEVVRNGTDNAPGAYPDGAINNLVGIRVGGQLYQYYLHLQEGSIPTNLSAGDTIEAGALLGRVGNSGVTLEPHLHMVLHYWHNAVPGQERYWSVPSEWSDVHRSRTPSGSSPSDYLVPQSGDWIAAEPF